MNCRRESYAWRSPAGSSNWCDSSCPATRVFMLSGVLGSRLTARHTPTATGRHSRLSTSPRDCTEESGRQRLLKSSVAAGSERGHAAMASPRHLAILKRGVREWNRWRKERHDVFLGEVPRDLSDWEESLVYQVRSANLVGLLERGDSINDVRVDPSRKVRAADLTHASLAGAQLSGANLMVADLAEADLTDADLRNADLRSAKLSRANLKGAQLNGANLWLADLRDANLSEAKLDGANLSGAFFWRANLRYASLFRANLRSADLAGTDLKDAILIETDLTGCIIRGANLTDATIDAVTFGNLDLSEVEGLDSCSHWGPSTLGLETVVQSKGKIPEVFLRGCGVPEEFITYIGLIVDVRLSITHASSATPTRTSSSRGGCMMRCRDGACGAGWMRSRCCRAMTFTNR